MIASLADWAAGTPVVLVIAIALVVFLAAFAVLVVAGVAVGFVIARLASRAGDHRNR